MDLAAYTLLALEGLFALWLLLHEGLLKSRRAMLVTLPLLIAAFVLRGYFLSYETLDYRDFLSKWVQFYRENLGFRSLAYPLGNYNIPYLYFLCFFSYLPMRDLYLIKLLSILFDVVLAYASMRLLGLCVKDGRVKLACFLTVLLLPTVVLNGAVWGQCDSIYVALALLGLWLGLSDRPVLSVLCFTLSFGFKLQAVFILPIMAVLWFRGNYRLWHFALFPAFYVLPRFMCCWSCPPWHWENPLSKRSRFIPPRPGASAPGSTTTPPPSTPFSGAVPRRRTRQTSASRARLLTCWCC